jgi:hypothetical protein
LQPATAVRPTKKPPEGGFARRGDVDGVLRPQAETTRTISSTLLE